MQPGAASALGRGPPARRACRLPAAAQRAWLLLLPRQLRSRCPGCWHQPSAASRHTHPRSWERFSKSPRRPAQAQLPCASEGCSWRSVGSGQASQVSRGAGWPALLHGARMQRRPEQRLGRAMQLHCLCFWLCCCGPYRPHLSVNVIDVGAARAAEGRRGAMRVGCERKRRGRGPQPAARLSQAVPAVAQHLPRTTSGRRRRCVRRRCRLRGKRRAGARGRAG